MSKVIIAGSGIGYNGAIAAHILKGSTVCVIDNTQTKPFEPEPLKIIALPQHNKTIIKTGRELRRERRKKRK